ncbi:hemerythrin domain-containing protein [Profundibacterium mesophilum]|uniref:Hemerythrin HHE cation binding domain containing protein n=1 Tax=Profundibacterium mesophilum KAUST100406-0324 TaxID=1037889 RepID=A0A921TCW4_9RHOB|nr:hemerythrin domain-containing protein [Profundibacterium mesophilum]KAF0675417.1 Hemerythrin HHE cation binding domain containing protein [Profundibacterium mesophilum KAUST100406-0324]
MNTAPDLPLETRSGLPEPLRVLVRELPREGWESHGNFDQLTRFWLDRHLMFRDLLAKLRGGSEAFLDGRLEARRHGRETGRYAGFLLNELHGHHQIEDVHYFPKLAGLDPRIEAGFALLDADHHALDGHIHALAGTTNALLSALDKPAGEDAVRDAAGTMHEHLTAFEGFIDRHLTDEEELVVPTLLKFAPKL